MSTCLTVENAQSHVTAFQPISEAARSWPDDNNISHILNLVVRWSHVNTVAANDVIASSRAGRRIYCVVGLLVASCPIDDGVTSPFCKTRRVPGRSYNAHALSSTAKRVCMWVCVRLLCGYVCHLSVREPITRTARPIFTNLWLCATATLPMAVGRLGSPLAAALR